MKQKVISILILLVVGVACTKETNSIPDYRVRLSLDTDLEDKALRIVTGYKTYTRSNIDYNPNFEAVGFGGVLVVHAVDEHFYAFDLACPYEANPSVRIEVDELSLVAVCPNCKTEYSVFSYGGLGAPNGVGKEYLKKYQVFAKDNKLTVTN